MVFSSLNYLFLVIFLLSAAVQYNDPDPLIWVAVYLAAGAMCLFSGREQQVNWLPPLLLLVSLGWIIALLPSIIGQVSVAEVVASISMKTREVEEAREIGGLLLVTFWASVVIVHRRPTR